MATHSSFLAWKIPRTEEPGATQSVGSQRVGLEIKPNHSFFFFLIFFFSSFLFVSTLGKTKNIKTKLV